ncbi:MAG: hypothetical protein EPO43_13325 [Rugosibacter sp.]|nr:MAG: hypothetical protein EPO43_13325 [Rugosibacter sp.]
MSSPNNHVFEPPAESPTQDSALRWLALLFSTGTLICCALPLMLVSLGFGAAFASMTSAFPPLVTLALHKAWVFGLSAALITGAGYSTFRSGRACPADPTLAAACARAQRLSSRLFWVALAIWSTGFVTAYVALPIRIWLGY